MHRRARSCRLAAPQLVALLFGLACGACGEPAALTVDMPLHLEEHLADAQVTGSVAPGAGETIEWRFDKPQPEWSAAPSWSPIIEPATVEFTGEALRVTLTEETRNPSGGPNAGVYVDVPNWSRDAWGDVVVRVRSDSTVSRVGLRVNLREGRGVAGDAPNPFVASIQNVPLVRDGTVQTYRLPWPEGPAASEVRQLGIWFAASAAEGPGSVDLLSVSVAPLEEGYRDPPLGMRQITRSGRGRRALYTNTPSRLAFRVKVPEGGRLDHGLEVLRADVPVTFRVLVEPARGEVQTLLEEEVTETSLGLQRSVDLSPWSGETVTLVLGNDAQSPGAIGLWSAPTVSGSSPSTKPNVIVYVIDTGAADQMSLYGYNRRTTPNLEAIAAEGAVFEWAHSNSNITATSTPSFMTSLHNSVFGKSSDRFEGLPAEAKTMAERFHGAGYENAVFTWNPNAGSASGLERGVDVFYDGTHETYAAPSLSSVTLHRDFWEWRKMYPGSPYWVHFQTMDVHRPTVPPPPFAGLFAPVGTSERTARQDSILYAWDDANWAQGTVSFTNPARYEDTGVDRVSYYDARRALYDETMAHQDYQLGRFVERLKESGEWENTLLVIASDHSIDATEDFRTLGADLESIDPSRVMLRSTASRVPLVFIWPGRIPAGQRIRERVSMIDVLPTVLELAGLPQPEIVQGQSLVPLLMGRPGWEPRPVIFDQIVGPGGAKGEPQTRIEVIDGRWGAALWMGPPLAVLTLSSPFLLYDIVDDPMAHHPVNDEHPDLVEYYTEFLTQQWEAHQLLAKRFTPGGDIELTAEQLETLRTLGYIR